MDDSIYLEFLQSIGDSGALVEDINDYLVDSGCKREIKEAKSGYAVSYLPQGSSRALATFVCRKSGVKLRMYPNHLVQYQSILDAFPDSMKKDIVKSSVCKRLINPDDCNPRCTMGYDFVMDGERYQKCKYMAFMPTVTAENSGYIKEFLQKELSCQ